MADTVLEALDNPATIDGGMRLIGENWSRNQQWTGTHINAEPVSTVVNLRSLDFKEPELSESQVHTLLNAAVGKNGFATPVAGELGQPAFPGQQLWHIEFNSVDDREDFAHRLEVFKAAEKGVVVNPASLDASMASPAEGQFISR